MRHIPISRAAVSAANLGTNYSSLLPWCTRFHGSRHLQSWFRSWLTNFNPIRKKLHDFWPLPKCYKISTTRADPLSQVRKQEWKHTHTHTHTLSLSLSRLGAILRSTKKTQTKSLSLSLSQFRASKTHSEKENKKKSSLFFPTTTEYNSLNSLKREMRKETERSSGRKKKH